MTCEIVVANRLGIALAADSAVTFSGANGTTYASGANKIFPLAVAAPVAIMIYNGASLNTIPWEILIKAYRRQLAARSFSSLSIYRDDLIDFLNDQANLAIPISVRHADAQIAYSRCAGFIFDAMMQEEPQLLDPTIAPSTLAAHYSALDADLDATLAAKPVLSCLQANDMANALISDAGSLATKISAHIAKKASHLSGIMDANKLAQQAIGAAYKLGPHILSRSYTGLVIAGYGESDYLPSYLTVHCYGFIGTRLLWAPHSQGDINHSVTASFIQGFAQQSMIETFTQGASPEIWRSIGESFTRHASEACRKAAIASGVVITDNDIQTTVANVANEFHKEWTFNTIEQHLNPLREIVAGLALEELSELAENLVMLQSLKEKVTSRTQSVGGPIDLAVITKEEGMVWIKRKHYFDPALNHRYIQRLQHPT